MPSSQKQTTNIMSTFSLSLKACFNKFFTQANISYNKCQLILSKTELLNQPNDIQLQSTYEYLILFCIIDKSCQETIVFRGNQIKISWYECHTEDCWYINW